MSFEDDAWSKLIKDIKPLNQKRIIHQSTISLSKKEIFDNIRNRHLNEKPLPDKSNKLTVFIESEKYFEKKHIENKLDLHGKTCEESKSILDKFFYQSQIKGIKTVLIITGKGVPKECNIIPNPGPYGVLRVYVCEWFKNNPRLVVCYSEAKIEHGGKGAFYVHVRKF